MRNFCAKNKLGFLDGTITKPTKGSQEDSLWIPVNSTLVGWVHNTLDPVLRSSVPQSDDVKDMWDDLKQRFSIQNGPRINELKSLLSNCKQRGQSMVNYYNELRKIWDELAGYSKVSACTCSSASGILIEKEDEKVHEFLIGLDSGIYKNAVSNILMMDPLPSLNIVFAEILFEERHYNVVRTQETKTDIVGFSAQVGARKNGNYSYCGKPGHDKEGCFRLIGFPEWWYEENREVTIQGRGGRLAGRGGGRVGTRAVTSITIKDSDRTGIPNLSEDQWTTLIHMMKSPSTENMSGPQDETDWN